MSMKIVAVTHPMSARTRPTSSAYLPHASTSHWPAATTASTTASTTCPEPVEVLVQVDEPGDDRGDRHADRDRDRRRRDPGCRRGDAGGHSRSTGDGVRRATAARPTPIAVSTPIRIGCGRSPT
jgi:hypothetical protein